MKENREEYVNQLIVNKSEPQKRLMLGVPMTGLLRSEWVMARYGQVIPCNWSMVDMIQYVQQWSPMQYLVADARNIIVDEFVKKGYEWLLFIDHDTIIPPGFLIRVNERMIEGKIPMWSGLYFTKSIPSEPLVYRRRGTGYYNDWKFGDQVWVDAIPMGCTLIHSSILKVAYEEAEEYEISQGFKVRRVFETPAKIWYDPERNAWQTQTGTEDIDFSHRVFVNKILEKAGWSEYQEKEYPYMIDTNLYCKHIDWNGTQYPARGEDIQFLPQLPKEKG